MKLYLEILTILGMLITIVILDYVWLGIITKKFLINQFGSLINVKNGSVQIKILIGIIVWILIALGVYIFAIYPSTTLTNTLILAALFGFICYAIYDLTNLSFIVNYPIKFAFVDILWGTFLSTIASLVGFFIRRILI